VTFKVVRKTNRIKEENIVFTQIGIAFDNEFTLDYFMKYYKDGSEIYLPHYFSMLMNNAFVYALNRNGAVILKRKDLFIDYKKCLIRYGGKEIPFVFDDSLFIDNAVYMVIKNDEGEFIFKGIYR